MRIALFCLGVVLVLVAGANSLSFANNVDAWPPKPVRLATGVSGHIHPAICQTAKGTLLVIFSQSDFKDLRLTRSTDGGRTWSEPVPFEPSAKLSIYPGSLTTLKDGRVVHAWNTWYQNEKNQKSRFVQYSISSDDGVTWSEPKSLPKNPESQSVIRHPIVELSETEWLFPLMDRTLVYNPKTEEAKPFADGVSHGLVPIVRTPKGTFVSGKGERSTDGGKSWEKIAPFPKVGADGWRYEMFGLDNGWLIASEVLGPGFGGERWRFVISRDDGKTWDFESPVVYYDPGRAINGRACPRTIPLDAHTLGTVFYDLGGNPLTDSGLLFIRVPIAKLQPGAAKQTIFDPESKLTVVADKGIGGEGPAWEPDLGILTSGNGNINRVSRQGLVSVFRKDAGTNGLLFDRQSRLLACEPVLRRVTRMSPDGSLGVLTDNYKGKKYNSPNDLTLDSKNRLYFSDPRYGPRDGMEQFDDTGKNTVEGVYRIDPDGTVARIIGREVQRANGVLVSADDKFLFVADNNNDTVGGARKLWRFDLKPDGTVDPKSQKLLYDWGKGRGPDGIKQDVLGRLYVAGGLNKPNPPAEPAPDVKGGIYVIDPDSGKLLDFLPVPTDEVTNCAFGGPDLRTLYITGGGTLYSIRTTTQGRIVWRKP